MVNTAAPATIQAVESVNKIAQYMADNLQADQLVNTAESIAKLAPILWGHYQREPCIALQLVRQPLSMANDELPAN